MARNRKVDHVVHDSDGEVESAKTFRKATKTDDVRD